MTQNPTDVPGSVLGQLGNRVQHALRAFTPDDAAALAKAVKTYPKTKDYDLSEALTQLGTGEAVITVLAESGAPTPVAWTRLRAPRSWMAQIDPAAQQQAVAGSPLQARYGQSLDRESAYERLTAKLAAPPAEEPEAPAEPCAPVRLSSRLPAGWLRGRGGRTVRCRARVICAQRRQHARPGDHPGSVRDGAPPAAPHPPPVSSAVPEAPMILDLPALEG